MYLSDRECIIRFTTAESPSLKVTPEDGQELEHILSKCFGIHQDRFTLEKMAERRYSLRFLRNQVEHLGDKLDESVAIKTEVCMPIFVQPPRSAVKFLKEEVTANCIHELTAPNKHDNAVLCGVVQHILEDDSEAVLMQTVWQL